MLRTIAGLMLAAIVLLLSGCGESTKSARPQASQNAEPVTPATEVAPQSVSDGDFEAVVLKSEKPVLVDFWAPWCGPCRTQGPIIEKVGAKYADKLRTVKLNVDDAPKTAKEYQVTAIPTLMVFKSGKVVLNRTGLMDETALSAELEKLF